MRNRKLNEDDVPARHLIEFQWEAGTSLNNLKDATALRLDFADEPIAFGNMDRVRDEEAYWHLRMPHLQGIVRAAIVQGRCS